MRAAGPATHSPCGRQLVARARGLGERAAGKAQMRVRFLCAFACVRALGALDCGPLLVSAAFEQRAAPRPPKVQSQAAAPANSTGEPTRRLYPLSIGG